MINELTTNDRTRKERKTSFLKLLIRGSLVQVQQGEQIAFRSQILRAFLFSYLQNANSIKHAKGGRLVYSLKEAGVHFLGSKYRLSKVIEMKQLTQLFNPPLHRWTFLKPTKWQTMSASCFGLKAAG